MILTKCDRCGVISEEPQRYFVLAEPRLQGETQLKRSIWGGHLCEACIESLEKIVAEWGKNKE